MLRFGVPILPELERLGIEPDQYLHTAINRLPKVNMVGDQHLLLELVRLNSLATRYIDINELEAAARNLWKGEGDAETATPTSTFFSLIKDAIAHRQQSATLGTYDVFRAWIRGSNKGYPTRPFGIDMLALAFGGYSRAPLDEIPSAARFLELLYKNPIGAEDFQFILALDGNRIVFRITSVLDDYIQSEGGVLIPRRALLTHFKEKFGGFTSDEIEELEELINNSKCSEREFQRFFETHPHFFRRWDYREVHPQVYLTKDRGKLIPDFILTDRELQKAAIIELKLPGPKLIRRQHNRDRFADAVSEARTQLLRYRDWFRDSRNRSGLKNRLGMEVYEPHLAVIIGRSSEFQDEMDRQLLTSDHKDIEVVTYDDILKFAQRRRLIIEASFF